jgi:hypothetical protein
VYRLARIGIGVHGAAQPVWGYEISGNYFDMLGVQPLLGRFFHPAEDSTVNGSPVAVLSYSCWKVRYGGDPHIVGKTIAVNKHPYTVLGVAPKNFNGTEHLMWPEVWVPIHNAPEIEGENWLEKRSNSNSWIVGRLKPGMTPVLADADLAHVAAQLAHDFPAIDKALALRVAKPGLMGDALGAPVRGFLAGVMLLALLVLLAACANLGGLFAARTADGARELGIAPHWDAPSRCWLPDRSWACSAASRPAACSPASSIRPPPRIRWSSWPHAHHGVRGAGIRRHSCAARSAHRPRAPAAG